MMCVDMGLFASTLFGILCTFWTCMSIPFTKLGKFSFTIFSNRFPLSCSFSYPSGTHKTQMLDLLELSQNLLILYSFFWISFSSCCSDWLGFFFFCFLMFQIIDLILGFIHSFTDGHLGCFQYLAIVNCAAINIGVHRFF